MKNALLTGVLAILSIGLVALVAVGLFICFVILVFSLLPSPGILLTSLRRPHD